MKKDDVWNDQINEDGISRELSLDAGVWDRGYYCETEDGVWYEVYVNDQTKIYWPAINLLTVEHARRFENFDSILLDHYEADNQITFFVANDEKRYTLEAIDEILREHI